MAYLQLFQWTRDDFTVMVKYGGLGVDFWNMLFLQPSRARPSERTISAISQPKRAVVQDLRHRQIQHSHRSHGSIHVHLLPRRLVHYHHRPICLHVMRPRHVFHRHRSDCAAMHTVRNWRVQPTRQRRVFQMPTGDVHQFPYKWVFRVFARTVFPVSRRIRLYVMPHWHGKLRRIIDMHRVCGRIGHIDSAMHHRHRRSLPPMLRRVFRV